MKIKLKDRKHKSGKIVAEIIARNKEVIRTRCLDSETIVNGKKPDSDYRTTYQLEFLDKYHSDYKYGKIIIEYLIFPGTKYSAFIVANIFQRTYLKLLFERYWFQRISGVKKIMFAILIAIISAIVGGFVNYYFNCK